MVYHLRTLDTDEIFLARLAKARSVIGCPVSAPDSADMYLSTGPMSSMTSLEMDQVAPPRTSIGLTSPYLFLPKRFPTVSPNQPPVPRRSEIIMSEPSVMLYQRLSMKPRSIQPSGVLRSGASPFFPLM